MPSASFVKQKKIGRDFENLLEPVFLEMGFKVYDSDHLKYRDKKGWDKELEIKGKRSKVELKLDLMSQQTGQRNMQTLGSGVQIAIRSHPHTLYLPSRCDGDPTWMCAPVADPRTA